MKHAKIHRINNMNKKLSDSFIKNNKTITITIIIIINIVTAGQILCKSVE